MTLVDHQMAVLRGEEPSFGSLRGSGSFRLLQSPVEEEIERQALATA